MSAAATALRPASADEAFILEARGAAGELLSRRDGEIVVSGPVFTGKTYPCLWKVHLAAAKYPGMRGLFCRKENSALAGSSLVTYRRHVLAALPEYAARVRPFGGSKMEPPGFRYPNGSFIAVGGVDDVRIMGSEYDLIFVDECTELEQGEWETLLTRRRWGVMPYQQMIGGCNPNGPSHWIWQRHAAGTLPVLFSRHRDNPRMHDGAGWTDFGREYLASLEHLTGHRRERLLLGRWVAAEGAVYPAFDRRVHVKAVDCEGWGTVLALDVGTRNPTCLGTIRHAGDRLHVEAEWYEAGLGSDDIADGVEARYRATGADHVVIDPSAAGVAASLRKRGVRVRPAVNDVAEGIRRVTSVLPDLTIDPSCANLIRELEGYRYPDKAGTDAPVKRDDHGPDMLRYGVMDLTGGSGPVRPVAPALRDALAEAFA